jgi:hypothetical protein
MASVPESDKPESLTTQTQVTIATRAPNTHDQGILWAHDKNTTVDFYIRSKISGAWRKVTLS